MWKQASGGGGGSGGTVVTDGVTIQGNGTSGSKIALKQVETDATLGGAGTLASPLGMATQSFYAYPSYASTGRLVTANTLWVSGFFLPYPLIFSHIGFGIQVQDAANNSDIGIYTQAGVLVANIGAQILGTLFWNNIPIVQSPQTIPPGYYLFAVTSNASTLSLQVGFMSGPWVINYSTGVSVGGALPASTGAQSVAPQNGLSPGFVLF
jgi:hypothetical protein